MRITSETTMEAMVAHIKTLNPRNLYASEQAFQRGVESYLMDLGWNYFHDQDSRQNRKGFPDLTAWRGKRLIFAELKLGKQSKFTMDQYFTLAELAATPAEVYLWLPWEDEILEVLNRV